MCAFVWEQITKCPHFPWLWWNRICPLCALRIPSSFALTWLSCLHMGKDKHICVCMHTDELYCISHVALQSVWYAILHIFWDLCICLELSESNSLFPHFQTWLQTNARGFYYDAYRGSKSALPKHCRRDLAVVGYMECSCKSNSYFIEN